MKSRSFVRRNTDDDRQRWPKREQRERWGDRVPRDTHSVDVSFGEHWGHGHWMRCRCWGRRRSWICTIRGPDSLRIFRNHEELLLVTAGGGAVEAACDDVQICTSKSSTRISIFVQLTRRPRSAWNRQQHRDFLRTTNHLYLFDFGENFRPIWVPICRAIDG